MISYLKKPCFQSSFVSILFFLPMLTYFFKIANTVKQCNKARHSAVQCSTLQCSYCWLSAQCTVLPRDDAHRSVRRLSTYREALECAPDLIKGLQNQKSVGLIHLGQLKLVNRRRSSVCKGLFHKLQQWPEHCLFMKGHCRKINPHFSRHFLL